ncbi:MAG TPA: MBL fold metallo-hydrolase [Bacillota bacterium]
MPLELYGRPLGPVQANCYVLVDREGGQALVIDPGAPDPWLWEQVEGLRVQAIVLTHAHFDHIGAVAELHRRTAAPILIHEAEAGWLTDPVLNGSARWEDQIGRVTAPPAHGRLEPGRPLAFAGREIEVRHTPGHSPGSVSLILDDLCFAGDTLFYRSIGRTDLPGGDHPTLLSSIRTQLLSLDDEVTVLPGHGPSTTIGDERRFNPFLKGWVDA